MLYNKLQKIFYNAVHKRCEPKEYLRYFTKDDFEELIAKPITIKSSKGHSLKGYLYHYDLPRLKTDRVIIFEHGMWSGHISYMKEIEILCRSGYVVLGYDHTGCFESEGEETYGFLQSLLDLNDVVEHFKSSEELKDLKIYVVGHSWGGFSAMNISHLQQIDGFVAISGFASLKDIINQNVPFFLPHSRKKLLEYESQGSEHAGVSGASLYAPNTRALFIHSRDDKTVKYNRNNKILQKKLDDFLEVTFLVLDGKGHNPTYTDEALKAKRKMEKDLSKALKSGKLTTKEEYEAFKQSHNWDQITEQDKDVWQVILNFLQD